MSTEPQIIPEPETAHTRGGPRTDEGKSASSKNATTHGLFAATDFIRPDELTTYNKLAESLRMELAPESPMELTLAHEIRGAVWRLRRCGQVESNLVIRLNDNPFGILDPMETANSTAERIQKSVDRARSQAHRLLHKCTAELRKLQTERIFRCQYFDNPADTIDLGLCDVRAVRKSLDALAVDEPRPQIAVDEPATPPASSSCKTQSSFCKTTVSPQTAAPQTPRNAPCPCKSGDKYKRCCGKDAPAVLHAA